MTSRRRKTRWKAVLLSVALAAVPVLGLNLLLWFHVRTTTDEGLQDAARTILKLAETRLDGAMTQVISFGLASTFSCTDEDRAQLRSSVLATSQIAEITVARADGSTACSSEDMPRITRQLTPANDTLDDHVKLSIVDFGGAHGPRAIKLTWDFQNGYQLYALVSGDALIPPLVVGRLQADFIMRLVMVDGTLITARQARADSVENEDGPTRSVERLSERYPLSIAIVVRPGALWESYRDLFVYANIGGLLLIFVIAAISLVVARQLEGPARALDDSLRRGEFIPYYQPVIDLVNGRLLGCEVLARRRHRDGTVDPPGAFIPTAESTGQIFEITQALMQRAKDEMSDTYQACPHLKLAFNLVADHFMDVKNIDEVITLFSDGPIRAEQLVFEVTERRPLPNLALARVVISRLQAFGAKIALDDVGTGHGGLSYLAKLGVDQMKIDKMFVDAIGSDRNSSAIIDTLIKLANDLDIDLVAEGVETETQVHYLRERGVRAAQGFIFAPPLPASSFIALVNAMTVRPNARNADVPIRVAARG